ncbi:MAG: EF-Tu/IF-2/RF-3 family GTPase [Candidatus Micrarchaeia archaeon]
MNFNVAILNDSAFAKELGKKGTSTDFTVYNLKQGDDTFCFFDPYQYPNKIQSLINVLTLTDSTILVVHKLDQYLGEMIVALDLTQRDKGLIIFGDYVEKDKFISMVSGNSIEKFIIVDKRPFEVYEKLKQYCKIENKTGDDFIMNIDAFFDVKGVGAVVIGAIKKGRVSVHDELQLYPYNKKVTVKSLQVHDEDVESAVRGSRIGLALKGIKVDELDRGLVLAKPGSLQVASEITIETTFSKYYNENIRIGKGYFVAIGMQYRQANLLDIKEKSARKKILKFQLHSPITFAKDDNFLVIDPAAKIRICGIGILV